jgi:hypothetical protein
MSEINPAGTMFLGLVGELMDLVKNPNATRIEVVMAGYELDDLGVNKLVGGKHSIAIRAFAINGMNKEVQEKLREQFDAGSITHLMVLWVRPGGMGMAKFDPSTNQKTAAGIAGCDDVEKSMISGYLHRQTGKR